MRPFHFHVLCFKFSMFVFWFYSPLHFSHSAAPGSLSLPQRPGSPVRRAGSPLKQLFFVMSLPAAGPLLTWHPSPQTTILHTIHYCLLSIVMTILSILFNCYDLHVSPRRTGRTNIKHAYTYTHISRTEGLGTAFLAATNNPCTLASCLLLYKHLLHIIQQLFRAAYENVRNTLPETNADRHLNGPPPPPLCLTS